LPEVLAVLLIRTFLRVPVDQVVAADQMLRHLVYQSLHRLEVPALAGKVTLAEQAPQKLRVIGMVQAVAALGQLAEIALPAIVVALVALV
jgi:hypothetical protein